MHLTLNEVADELTLRLCRIFLRGPDGARPVFGDAVRLQQDPHFRDLLQFHEYFHGDTGRGVGASHQTGWTGLVAKLLHPRRCHLTGRMLDVTVRQRQRAARVAAPEEVGT
jgi:hypothetical protein